MSSILRLSTLLAMGGMVLAACGSDDDDRDASTGRGSPEQTGAICETVTACYPNVAEGALMGDALCLTEVRGGYCTHTCSADEDCCAAEGECETELRQVCSPFQSTGQTMCFLSCEAEDISDGTEEQEYCQREASRDFICRSSGGGSENRKVCVPGECGVGAACAADTDCSGDLTCALGIVGGYCTRTACTDDTSCPQGSRCVQWDDDTNYCLRECAQESDCSFCRGEEVKASCSSEAQFADGDASQAVCVPRR